MSEQIDPSKRHEAKYIPHSPSPSGKNQWRCIRCGRTTQGLERECYTIQMRLDELQAEGTEPTKETILATLKGVKGL